MTVRVRYAPSPTGHLHIGGVRTALFNWLFARHHGGQFLLRIEDTDTERHVEGAEAEMLDGFRWLGIDWDEGPDIGGPHGPYRCTERLPRYQAALARLVETGWAYPCFCTADELEADRQAALRQGVAPRYSGRCRRLSERERQRRLDEGLAHTWRLAVPSGQTLSVNDAIRGRVEFASDDLGDFVIVKTNGMPTYNFQVVVDDAEMEITHVIRGEEHLSNTPRQLLVYQALDWPVPVFAHLPQVLNEHRKKLSKRDPDVLPVHVYRQQGYLPEALVNFLALLGWSPGDEQEILPLAELCRRFDFDRVGASGAVFDAQKLHWMANQYFKVADLDRVLNLIAARLRERGVAYPPGCGREWLAGVVRLYQEQLACADEFVDLASGFFTPSVELSPEAEAVLAEDSAKAVVRRYLELVQSGVEPWTAEGSRARFRRIQEELGVRGRGLFMPVRAALTGTVHGPDLQQTVSLLPRAWVEARLTDALA
ncbi:glutamate--tRNA ligase [Alicyclobacillus shizuokensis]|uniref:glutamate--tRNA ligase n=1 Tax=Alicyclobacillus shizuokensis TaxID=392014 RepID=UPI000833C50B|nr:glutamate--tRNA ligase [Alicyclobacillus shizuokensis]